MAKTIRIQKYLGDGGILSRRKTEEYIKAGRITVNGRPAAPGHPVAPGDVIAIDGQRVRVERDKENLYLMLNKPRGYVTTTSDELGRRCVTQLLEGVEARVYPVGRLDRDSEGLLLLTNDGQFANLIMHPSHHIGKTYRVTVRPGITEDQCVALAAGVDIGKDGEKEITAPATVLVLEKYPDRAVVQITIAQGKNRQVRRMCEALGLTVARLKRTAVGPLRLGMLPPGDVRNCLEALANVEPLMGELLHYRFTEGSLKGQSFGNLFLAALNGISGGSFDQAVSRMSQVLAITGRVLPVTTADVQLEAEFENGARVLGESKIFYCKKREDCRIRRVRLLPSHPPALAPALEAIREADMILLGPGSLYTSIIPNLLVEGIAEAIAGSDALKIYIANVMTQEGETEGYTNADHIRAIFQHSLPDLFHLCLVNSSQIPEEVAANYAREGAEPLRFDKAACAQLGVELISRPVSAVRDGRVRHDPELLAAALLELHAQRSVRIAGLGRYRTE